MYIYILLLLFDCISYNTQYNMIHDKNKNKKINSQNDSSFNNYEHDYLNIVPISKYYIYIYIYIF